MGWPDGVVPSGTLDLWWEEDSFLLVGLALRTGLPQKLFDLKCSYRAMV